MIHETPTSKAYYDINTAAYESYDDIIKDIMNFFFVSGESILTNMMEDFEGKDDFEDFSGYSSTSFFAVNNDSLVLDYEEHGSNQTVSASDEINYYDIPAGTSFSYDYTQTLLNNGNRTRGVEIDMTMYYERDGQDWTRRFARSQLYDGDFEYEKISKPSENGYTEVYSIYDL